MPTLGNILDDSARLEIETNDGPIHIDYYPSRVTQKMYKQLTKFSELLQAKVQREELDEELLNIAFNETNNILIGLIKSWDLNEQEEPEVKRFPLDAERWTELPMWLIDEISQKVIGRHPNQVAAKMIQS